jgi:glycosyltransferase involved in cell wall biosynthesis
MTIRVVHYVDSSGPGGIESHLAALLPALRAAGVDAQLALHANYGPHPLREALDAAGVPHRTLSTGFGGLRSLLRADLPALLHTHGYKAGLLGRAARLLGGPPVVSTMHSGDLGSGRVGLYNRLDAATARLSELIVVSAALSKRHPTATLIPNGVTIPGEAQPPGAAIGFVGRLSPEKGPLAFAEMAAARPDARFVAFGDGPLRAELSATAPANLDLRGAVPSMDAHWPEIGLLVMPSVFEGLPMAALEAMARGTPVAAYAVGGLPELLCDGCGFLAPPGDRAALADAVRAWAAMGLADRGALSARARARVEARFGIAACAEATASVYRRTLARERNPVGADRAAAAP